MSLFPGMREMSSPLSTCRGDSRATFSENHADLEFNLPFEGRVMQLTKEWGCGVNCIKPKFTFVLTFCLEHFYHSADLENFLPHLRENKVLLAISLASHAQQEPFLLLGDGDCTSPPTHSNSNTYARSGRRHRALVCVVYGRDMWRYFAIRTCMRRI